MFMNLVKTLGHIHCTIYNARTTTVPYAFIVVLTIVRYNYPLHFTGYVHIHTCIYMSISFMSHLYVLQIPCLQHTKIESHVYIILYIHMYILFMSHLYVLQIPCLQHTKIESPISTCMCVVRKTHLYVKTN